MSNTYTHEPIWTRWNCVLCGGTYSRTRSDSCTCNFYWWQCEDQWVNKQGHTTDWPRRYEDNRWSGTGNGPPPDFVRYHHKVNRQHVRLSLKDLEGNIDWEQVESYTEPMNVKSNTSARWDWW